MAAIKKPDLKWLRKITYQSFSQIAAVGVSLIGVLVLFGWYFDYQPFTTIAPGFASMKPTTALGFMLSGFSLFSLCKFTLPFRNIGVLASILVISLGVIALAEYAFNWNVGLDVLFFEAEVLAEAELFGSPFPGRMSQITAVMFIVSGSSLLSFGKMKSIIISQGFAIAGLMISLFGFTSYLYSVESLYIFEPYSSFALHTCLAFIFLILGILSAAPDRGVMPFVTGPTIGADLSRKLLVAVVWVSLVLGWLSWRAETSGYFESALALAILTVAYIVVFAVIIFKTTGYLNKLDKNKTEVEAKLAVTEQSAKSIINTAMDAIITIDEQQNILVFNEAAEQIFGHQSDEILGEKIETLIPGIYRQTHTDHIRRFGKSGVTKRQMGDLGKIFGLKADGTVFPLEASISHVNIAGEKYFTAIVRDITNRLEMQEKLRVNEEHLKSFIQYAPAAIAMFDSDMRYLLVSQRWLSDYKLTEEDVIGRSHYEVFPDLPKAWKEIYQRCFAGESVSCEKDAFVRDTGVEWLHWEVHPWYDKAGQVGGISMFTELITDQVKANEQILKLNRIYRVLSGINNLIIRIQNQIELVIGACDLVVKDGGFEGAWIGSYDKENRKLSPIAYSGKGVDEMLPDTFELDQSTPESSLFLEAFESRKVVVINDMNTYSLLNNDVIDQYVQRGYKSMIILPLFQKEKIFGNFTLFSIETDYFDEKELEVLDELASDISFSLGNVLIRQQAETLEFYDALTGLPNQFSCMRYLSNSLESLGKSGRLAVLLIDIRRFHQINDSLGREAGDILLQVLADRLRLHIMHPEVLSRVGPNCFALVLPEISNHDLAHRVDKIIMGEGKLPIKISGENINLTLSGGIAVYSDDGQDSETLYLNAEAALARAKLEGGSYKFYEPALNEKVADTLKLENDLRQGLLDKNFVLHYQPKISLKNNKLTGFEALLRFQHPQKGLLPPNKFIPLLEDTGLIVEVGNWVIRQVIQDWLSWNAKGLKPPRIAANISSLQLKKKGFIPFLKKAIEAFPSGEVALDLEITESILMENIERTIKKIKSIKDLGIKFSIDDFGTGYSSLEYLAKLAVDSVKIDRSFVNGLERDQYSLNIIKMITSLSHSLGLKVIAEGVDNPAKIEILATHGCDEIQGYLVARPLPFEEAEIFLQKSMIKKEL